MEHNSALAASVVPKDRQASAVATMFMGLTIANIGGVPAATWLGQQVGWREAFAGTAVLGLIAMAALWLALPQGAPGQRPDIRRELRILTRPRGADRHADNGHGGRGDVHALYLCRADPRDPCGAPPRAS